MLKRKDTVELIAKYLVMEFYELPYIYMDQQRFDDVEDGVAPQKLFESSLLVKGEGIITDQNLKPNAALTKDDMALMLMRAYSEVSGFDFINHVSTQSYSKKITDISAAKKQTQAAIAVLDYYGIAKGKATLGEFAYTLHKLMQVKPPADGIKAIGSVDTKTIRVVFNDFSTKVVKLNTTLKANKATTVSFKVNGKTHRGTVTYKKPREVLKTEAVFDKVAKIILSDGTVHTYENNLPLWTNSSIIYAETLGNEWYNFSIKVNELVMHVRWPGQEHLSQFKFEFNQPIGMSGTLTSKQLEKYVILSMRKRISEWSCHMDVLQGIVVRYS